MLSLNQADLGCVYGRRRRKEREQRRIKGTEKELGVMEKDRYWHPRALAASASVL